jgi:hypothetical protein
MAAAALKVSGIGSGIFTAAQRMRAALNAPGSSDYLMSATTEATPPQPENGPSGGSRWLSGYTPKFDDTRPKTKRRNRRDELLFLTA